ncbi:uncharacterized protein LOC129143943 isoform X5 [Pan troglodytes]|uniref:uncharacterized protein LOC129143943 isoform X5 n=1 Tax=Pan troglodytes TaxID=9598 RepID=UPI0030136E72
MDFLLQRGGVRFERQKKVSEQDQLVKYEAPSDHAYHTAGFFWTYQAYRQTVRAEIHRELEMVHLRSSPSRSRRYNLAVGQPRIAVSW